MEEPLRTPFHASKHALFCFRSLKFLPTPYQAEDNNRMALAYFCLSSLSLLPATALSPTNDPSLSALDALLKPDQRKAYINWVYEQQVPSGGFRGSDSMSGSEPNEAKQEGLIPLETQKEQDDFDRLLDYPDSDPDSDAGLDSGPSAVPTRRRDHPLAPANLIQTYTALLILGILGDDYARVDRDGLRRFMARCQQHDGSFLQFPSCPERGDPRSTYSAFVLASLINDWSAIDVEAALEFLTTCQRPDGGFATCTGLEAQGGTTYCSIASFALCSHLSSLPHPQSVLRWLISRQVSPPPPPPPSSAPPSSSSSSSSHDEPLEDLSTLCAGFQGRPSKPPDACYSFWSVASLALLAPLFSDPQGGRWFDAKKDREWLLRCQHEMYGGLAREPEAMPDVYHTYLSLAALSLGSETSNNDAGLALKSLDPAWNVSHEIRVRIEASSLHAKN